LWEAARDAMGLFFFFFLVASPFDYKL
jgi:hypothetical protein